MTSSTRADLRRPARLSGQGFSIRIARRTAAILAILSALVPPLRAASYHVSPTGNDGAPGSPAAPFRTIQRGADALRPGDTCFLHAGTYRQTVRVAVSGEPNRLVRIEAWPGDLVILSGTEPVTGEWSVHEGRILKTTRRRPVGQLFVDGELMTEARWPDMPFARRWERSAWRASGPGTRYGVMVDPALAETGIDWTGAVATLNVGSWQTFRRIVRTHGKGADRFTYDRDASSRLARAKPHRPGFDRYFLAGKLEALDTPGEWFHDRKTHTLYLWPTGEGDLSARRVEAKVQPYALRARGVRHVVLRGLHFFATTLKIEDASACRVENVHLRFGHGVHDPFGPPVGRERLAVEPRDWASRRWFQETSVVTPTFVGGEGNTVVGCSLAYANGTSIVLAGPRNTLDNCLIHDVDWYGLDTGLGVDLLGAPGATVRYCTIFNMGSSEGVRISNRGRSIIEYNYIHHGGMCQSDGSLVQCATPKIAGTVLRYNWLHDHNAFNWGGTGLRGDDKTRGLIVHHNVAWRCPEKSIITKGDGNRVYNNTCVDNPRRDILLPIRRLPGKTDEIELQNAHSEAINNCGRVSGRYTWERKDDPPAGRLAANYEGGKPLLVDPARRDFRPRPGSPLVDAGQVVEGVTDGFRGKAPDIGAYELGAPRWVPGHRNAVWVLPAPGRAVRVRLTMPPLEELAVEVQAGAAGTAFRTLRFTPGNWPIPQTVPLGDRVATLRFVNRELDLSASVDVDMLPDPEGEKLDLRTIP